MKIFICLGLVWLANAAHAGSGFERFQGQYRVLGIVAPCLYSSACRLGQSDLLVRVPQPDVVDLVWSRNGTVLQSSVLERFEFEGEGRWSLAEFFDVPQGAGWKWWSHYSTKDVVLQEFESGWRLTLTNPDGYRGVSEKVVMKIEKL